MELLVHLQNALTSPRVSFLRALDARPILDHNGIPVVTFGHTALVARLRGADGRELALRIAQTPRDGQDWPIRYRALGVRLNNLGIRQLPADIRVLEGGVPDPIPIPQSEDRKPELLNAVAMEWIGGPTLLQAVDRAARGNNVGILRALANALIASSNQLSENGLTHGDLTATNIIVRADGTLAFVDLDSLTWEGAPLGGIGSGSDGYRTQASLDAANRDRFGLLTLYTSLVALADDPDLRRSYGDPDGTLDGTLLFSEWDIAEPGSSELIRELPKRIERAHLPLLDAYVVACRGGQAELDRAIGLIPGLHQVSTGTGSETWSTESAVDRIKAWYGGPSESPEPAVEQMEEVTPQRAGPVWDWSVSSISESAPEPEPDLVGNFLSEDREALLLAVKRRDEAEVARLWSRLASDPVSQLAAGQVSEILARGLDKRIKDAARHHHDDQVIGMGEEAAARHLSLSKDSRKAIREVQERLTVRQELETALLADQHQQMADLAVSGRLAVLGDADRESLRAVLRSIEQPLLERALVTDDDLLIIDAFDEELFPRGEGLEQATWQRVLLAKGRVAWLDRVRQAMKQRNAQDLTSLFMSPPPEGTDRLASSERRRIRRMIQQHQALEELNKAITAHDEGAIVAALHKVERVGARVSDRFAWGSIQRFVEQISVIEGIAQAAEATPVDHARLAQLIPVAKALGIERDPRLQGDLAVEVLEKKNLRAAQLRRLRLAIRKDDDVAIATTAMPDPHGALDELDEDERDRIARALWTVRRDRRDLVGLLQEG